MNFEMPMAAAAMNNAVAYANVDEGSECWDVIGDSLDHGVDRTLVDYDNKLELNLQPKPGLKRQEVSDLRWGKIEKDAARLEGLAAAIENISSVVKKGKDQLAHEWKGESFDAFRASIEKVEQTLNEYAKAAKATGQGFRDAMGSIRSLYGKYRDESLNILKFEGMAPPNDWWKFTGDDAEFMASRCTSHGALDVTLGSAGTFNCTYNDDEQKGAIVDKFVNRRLYDRLEKWDCTDNPGVSLSQYRDTASDAATERSAISRKINEWYVATDRLKDDVGQVHTAALDNLQVMAERKVFQSMQTPAAPTGGTGDPGQGDPGNGRGDPGTGGRGPGGTGSSGDFSAGPGGSGPGSTGSGPGGTGMDTGPGGTDPGGTGTGGAGTGQPVPEPGTEPDPGTNPQGMNETVTIEDGNHKISVSSPDGQGNVQVTVDDGTGKPKTYDMNFGSGTTPSGAGGTDPVRTLPFPNEPVPAGDQGEPGPGDPRDPGSQVPGEDPTQIEPGPDGTCVISDPPMTITAERPPGTTDQVIVTVDDGSGNPTTYTLDYAAGTASPAGQPLRAGMPEADPRVGVEPASFGPGGAPQPVPGQGFVATEPVAAGGPGGFAEPAYAGGPGVDQNVPAGDAVDQGAAVGGSLETGGQTLAQGHAPGDGGAATGFGGTSGGGQVGSVGLPGGSEYTSVPTQPTGEASLASASDSGSGGPQHAQGQGGGMSGGGGMPMMAGGGMGAGGGGDTDRGGSQWRTHGDLFDDAYAEAAGRFGGVLEPDDPGSRR